VNDIMLTSWVHLRYFSIMDVDSSGDLSPEEIRNMFARIDIKVDTGSQSIK
jgi:hypothetical protein